MYANDIDVDADADADEGEFELDAGAVGNFSAGNSRMFSAPDTPTHKRKFRVHFSVDTDANAKTKTNVGGLASRLNGCHSDGDDDEEDEGNSNRLACPTSGMLQRSDAVALASNGSSYEDGDTIGDHIDHDEDQIELDIEFGKESVFRTIVPTARLGTSTSTNTSANGSVNLSTNNTSANTSATPSASDTQLRAKVTLYELEIQELRSMLHDASDRCAQQLLAERRKQQQLAAQLDAKFQDEFEQFEQHHRHELVQVQRDYEARLARLNRELEAARVHAASPPQTCTTDSQTATMEMETVYDSEAQFDLTAVNDEKLVLQRLLSSVLRGFVRIKQTVLPAAADSDFEACLARLSTADDEQCNAIIDEWTDELVAALGPVPNGLVRPDSFWEVSLNRSNSSHHDVSASSADTSTEQPQQHDTSEVEVDRLSRSLAELKAAKRDLEFRIESREVEFAKQSAEHAEQLAERDAQVDAAQRQIRSLRTFVDELLVDREAERDEHTRRVSQLEHALTRRGVRRTDTDDMEIDVGADAEAADRVEKPRRKRNLDDDEDEIDGPTTVLSDAEDAVSASESKVQKKRSQRLGNAPLNSTMNEKQRPAGEDGEAGAMFPFELDDGDMDALNHIHNGHGGKSGKQLEMSAGLYDELLAERNEEVAFLNRRIEQLNEEIVTLKIENEAVSASERHDVDTQTDAEPESDRRARFISDSDPDPHIGLDDELDSGRSTNGKFVRANSLAHELGLIDDELERVHPDTSADLQNLRDENDSLRQSVDALRSQLADSNADLQLANGQLENLEAEVQKMMQFNASLTHDFDDVQSMLERKQTELERAQDEADERLKEAVKAVTGRYESLLTGLKLGNHSTGPSGPGAVVSETFSEVEEEFYVLKERVRDLSAQLEAVRSERDAGSTDKTSMNNTIDQLRTSSGNLERTVAVLQEEKVGLQEEKAVLQKENAGLQEEKAVLQKDKAVLQEEKAALQKDKAGLQEEKAALQKDKAGLQEEKAALQKDKAGLQEEKAALQKDKAGLQEEKTALHKEKVGLQEEKTVLQKDKAGLLEEKTALQKEKVGLQEEKAVLQKDKAVLQEEKAALQNDKAVLQEEKAALQKDKVGLQEEKAVLQKEKAALQKVNSSLEADNAALREQQRARLVIRSIETAAQTEQVVKIVPPCANSAAQTVPTNFSKRNTTSQTDPDEYTNGKKETDDLKDDAAMIATMRRYQEQLGLLVADWTSLQGALSRANAQRGQADADANVKELKRKLDAELGRAAQLDAELRSFLSVRVVTTDEEQVEVKPPPLTDTSNRRDSIGSDLLPLLRSKLEVADIDLLRILESIDYRLRQERLLCTELRESLEAERVRAIEIMSELARERSHSMDVKLELQTARTKADDLTSRFESEALKRKQLEALLEKQRSENATLQEHLAKGMLNDSLAIKSSFDYSRLERTLRGDLEAEKQKRMLLEIESERSSSDLRTKRREFEELLRKFQLLERAKEDEVKRLRNELQTTNSKKDAQIDELSRKASETERQLTDANVQLRNHEALLREFKSRVEVQHDHALQLETTVQQLRTRLQTTLRMHGDEKATLLAQIEREKAASKRVQTQTTVFEQLTQASARLSLGAANNNDALEQVLDELYKRLQRAEAHRRSLAYQKRYLNVVLSRFEQTEHVTLAELARVTDALDVSSKGPQSVSAVALDSNASGKTKYKFNKSFFLFRSGARVIIAAQRLSKMPKRWEDVRCPLNLRSLTNGNVSGTVTPRSNSVMYAQSALTSRRSSFAPLANGFDSIRSPHYSVPSVVSSSQNHYSSYR